MMLKISQKIRHTNKTLKMEGTAPTKALTTTWKQADKTDRQKLFSNYDTDQFAIYS